jgi:hypothetical protein
VKKLEQEREASHLVDNGHRSLKPGSKSNSALGPLYQLQKRAGNQAFLRMVEAGVVKPKLRVSQPGDADEIEADRIADSVLSAPAPATLQRKCFCSGGGTSCPECEVEEVEPAKGIHRKAKSFPTSGNENASDDFIESLGPGQPLDSSSRSLMESRFGQDFGQVRIHNDSRGAEAAAALDARAFTLGRHIVFGNGEFTPQALNGKTLLAHELSHVLQQNGGGRGAGGTHSQTTTAAHPKLQRQGFTELAARGAAGLAAGVSQLVSNPQLKQFANDLLASVKEAPLHVGEILVGEVWEAIKAHWVKFLAVTTALIAAEIVIGILTGVPEPTLLTKLVAFILQVLVIAILGYFAAVELIGVYEEGKKWFSLAKSANGDPKTISEASRSFLRMIRHIILAILTLIGVRARVRGLGGAGAATGSATESALGSSRSAASEGAATPIPGTVAGPPQLRVIRGEGGTSAGDIVSSRGSAFEEGAAARQLQPAEPSPVREVPLPTPKAAESVPTLEPTPAKGAVGAPGAASAPAAGVSAATSKEEEKRKSETVYAFGSSTKPGGPRRVKDIEPDENDYVGPTNPPTGASTFADPSQAPLTGHYHGVAKTAVPSTQGLQIVADGSDVGGPHRPTHHTIFPSIRMLFQEFVNKFQGLPWKHSGKK